MSTDIWQLIPMGELAATIRNAIVGGPFGSNLVSRDYTVEGVPVIRGQNMGERWVGGEFVFVSDEKASELGANLAKPGDLVFTQRGTLGQVALVPKTSWPKYLISQSQMKASVDPEKADALFLYYYFSSEEQRQWIFANATQTGVPHINLGTLRKHPVRLPPLTEQCAIAGVLGALDNKIEANRRTSQKLEKVARAIFHAWFVDFEPVKAKVVGTRSFPGISQEVFDALPTRLVESELGPVPEGWAMMPLDEVMEVNPSRRLAKGIPAPYLDMAQMPTDGHAPTSWSEREPSSGARFMNGDTLVARITPCLENGKTAFVDFLDEGQVACGSTEYIVLRPKPPIPNLYAYLLARTPEFRTFAIQHMTGSSGRQRVPFGALSKFNVAVAPASVMQAFGEAVEPLFSRSSASVRESRALAALRDYLLPKLLSGEVRVGEI